MPSNKKTPKTHTRALASGLGLAVVLAVIAAFILLSNMQNSFSGNNPQKDDGKMAGDLNRLSTESYEAVLLSMHSTEYFREEDFVRYRGLNTLVASHAILNTKEYSQYLECIFRSANSVSALYLCPDPELLWTAADQKPDSWERNLAEDLFSHINAHPEVSFSVLLPYPYIGYWTELDPEKLDILLERYRLLLDGLYACPNVRVFFPGAENWLTLNPGNYTDTLFDANEIITQSIFLHVFCDENYEITPESEDNYIARLLDTVAGEKNSSVCRADLSDWCLVFFGDSVLGNYSGSFSIPGYVNGLSGASVYNYAVGGTPASYSGEDIVSFPHILDRFLAEEVTSLENGFRFTPNGVPEEELSHKKLCFLINYGFNDYFNGAPVENPEDPYDIRTFKGSLRTCITTLQEKFPDSCQILITPTHTRLFDCGMEINGEKGDIFSAYIYASMEVASETGTYLLDNYSFIASEQDMDAYLADGCHPNETGRLILGCRIVRFLEEDFTDTALR